MSSSTTSRIVSLSAATLLSAVAFTQPADSDAPLSATESDPAILGWMQGFPPPPERRIGHPESDFFSFPKLRWTVCHIRELLPTASVGRGIGSPIPLPYALDPAIETVTFTPLGGSGTMTWKEAFDANYTDGLLVLHKGQIVYERYAGCLDELGKHAAMSMTKSIIGLLAEILVAEGRLDEDSLVASIIPELTGSAFGSATVRQVMDMTTGIRFNENYADPDADIWAYNRAASPLPIAEVDTGPRGYFEYLATVAPEGRHGEAFGYRTVNTDVLGWIIARTVGQPVTEHLSERIWRRMGAEQDGYFTIDSLGTPFAGGGLSAGLRDLARIGQLMLNKGEINGQRLFPAEAVLRIEAGGSKEAFAKAGYKNLSGGSYRSMWWMLHNSNGAYAARGVHGQTIYIDPTAEMVIVRFASNPVASNSANDPTSLPAYQAVADFLMAKK